MFTFLSLTKVHLFIKDYSCLIRLPPFFITQCSIYDMNTDSVLSLPCTKTTRASLCYRFRSSEHRMTKSDVYYRSSISILIFINSYEEQSRLRPRDRPDTGRIKKWKVNRADKVRMIPCYFHNCALEFCLDWHDKTIHGETVENRLQTRMGWLDPFC